MSLTGMAELASLVQRLEVAVTRLESMSGPGGSAGGSAGGGNDIRPEQRLLKQKITSPSAPSPSAVMSLHLFNDQSAYLFSSSSSKQRRYDYADLICSGCKHWFLSTVWGHVSWRVWTGPVTLLYGLKPGLKSLLWTTFYVFIRVSKQFFFSVL